MTYVQLGNHTRKHRVKQIREKFWIHKSQKQKQDPCGHINAPKVFRRRLQVRFDSVGPALPVNKSEYTCLRASSLHLYVLWTIQMHCGNFRHTFELTGSWSEFPAVKQGVGMHGSNCWQMLQNMPVISYKISCERQVGLHVCISPKIFTIFQCYIPGYWVRHHSWQKRRIKQTKESFFIDKLHKILAISSHQKRFPDDCN